MKDHLRISVCHEEIVAKGETRGVYTQLGGIKLRHRLRLILTGLKSSWQKIIQKTPSLNVVLVNYKITCHIFIYECLPRIASSTPINCYQGGSFAKNLVA